MTPYISSSGKSSGVKAYEIGRSFIKVQFETHTYLYTYTSADKQTIEQMKQLALNSNGLSTFISQNNPNYEDSWPNGGK